AFARFIGDCCTFISPSRPGYLRTPLTSGPSPAAQADLFVALLDTLQIEKASVLGFSGGGPSAIQFALRHSERCHSLIMIGALVRRSNKTARLQTMPFWQRLYTRIYDTLLVSDPFLYLAGPVARLLPHGTIVEQMLYSGTHYHLRRIGYENDLVQFAAIAEKDYPFEAISVPTLVVHGTRDEDVPFEDARLLAAKAQHSTLLALPGSHESFYMQAKIVMPAVRDFITGPA
ncbi:MAG: alpha/beta hydrolase, partial [Ktedonobacteraceae bacterium]|nr:alpha/beta hydrolase [Ktedonobacteraceae bacterium]